MTNRTSSRRASRNRADSGSRAEARRKSRLVVQGGDDAPDAGEETAAAPQPTFLQRMFPAAPPLRGKGDPLAGFTYEGPLRPAVVALYLLSRNPLAWIAPAGLYVLTWEFVLLPGAPDQIMLLIAQVAQYVLIAAAGWFGWQRPWIFGGASGALASAGTTALFVYLGALMGRGQNASALSTQLFFDLAFYFVLGAALGWYGGYLRRRLAAPNQGVAARSGRR